MNKIEQNILDFSKDQRFASALQSSKELLQSHLEKIKEIETCNNIELPKFVKDNLINYWFSDKSKKAFIEMVSMLDDSPTISYKAAKWLLDNKVIKIIRVFSNKKPAVCQINNIPSDWICYEQYETNLIQGLKDVKSILNDTFEKGMNIFK